MSKLNQTVLVIGGAGYIGSHIVLELCERDYDVTVFDNLSTGYKKNIDLRAKFIQGDILNQNDLSNIFQKDYCAVFHFAALKAAGESMLEPGKYADVTLLEWDDENRMMDDCFGSSRSGGYFKPIMTIKGGKTVSP